MARKLGQIIALGERTWLVRVYVGRDPQTGTRKYHNQTIHGPFREAQRFLNLKLEQRDDGPVTRAAVLSLNQLLDQWLTMVVKARVRARTFKDYEALLKLYIRPALGSSLIGTVSQIDIQSLYTQMFERGLRSLWAEVCLAFGVIEFRACGRVLKHPLFASTDTNYTIYGIDCFPGVLRPSQVADEMRVPRSKCSALPMG